MLPSSVVVELTTNKPSTPPNVKFEIDDLEEPWNYSRPFDYIHSRMMNGSIADWSEYFKKCYESVLAVFGTSSGPFTIKH